jgi:hypothetical protein
MIGANVYLWAQGVAASSLMEAPAFFQVWIVGGFIAFLSFLAFTLFIVPAWCHVVAKTNRRST